MGRQQRRTVVGGDSRLRHPAGGEEVADHLVTAFGQHRLGMELHPEHRCAAVLDAHDDPVGGLRGDREDVCGQGLVDDRQGVISDTG